MVIFASDWNRKLMEMQLAIFGASTERLRKLGKRAPLKGLLVALLGTAITACEINDTHAQLPTVSIERQAQEFGQDCQNRLVRISTESVWYCGVLNAELVGIVRQNWTPSTKTLILSSEGGMSSGAIQLANLLNELGAKVQIRLICMSACAHFVFMGVSNVFVEEGAVVAFHHTSTQNLLTYGDRAPPNELQILQRESDAERAFYSQIGIDERFLLWPGIGLNVLCVGPGVGSSGTEWGVVTQVGWMVPSRTAIQNERREDFDGWWPSARVDVANGLARIAGQGLTFMYGVEKPGYSWGQLSEYLRDRPTCPT